MLIHEAINSTCIKKPYITRKSWYTVEGKWCVVVAILPTNSPDRCIAKRTLNGSTRCMSEWAPSRDDLVADDWETVPFNFEGPL